jgi:hypothetical protein
VFGGCETVSVIVVELDRVRVDPSSQMLIEGESLTVRATPLGAGGEVLTGRTIRWTSSNPSVASLSTATGSQVTVSAESAGSARIQASSDGRTAEATIEVLVGPSLVLSTSELTIEGRQGEVAAGVDVGIGNGGNGSISGLVTGVEYLSGAPGWLTVGLNGTTVPTTATLVASGVGLAIGTYEARVSVTAPVAGGLAASLVVTFEVRPPPPTIVLASNSVGLTASFANPVPATALVPITNGGGGALTGLVAQVEYPPEAPSGWLSAVLSSTTAPTTLTVSALATGLPVGTHQARVAITSPVAEVSPVYLDVTFRIAPPGGVP